MTRTLRRDQKRVDLIRKIERLAAELGHTFAPDLDLNCLTTAELTVNLWVPLQLEKMRRLDNPAGEAHE